jgi:glycosyltransferase involved in cell wall biosynthesis
MRETYHLPERFFFLPNQFWRHKNHALVIDALARLKAEGALGPDAPPVILTGLARDPRNPGYFDWLTARVQEAGVESHFRYLGLIPYDHVLSLGAACDALINPSRFEGWSTPIEEAKAFAAPLMLSDIPIHGEQAPAARFFDPDSPQALAEAMLDALRRPPPTRPGLAELVAMQNRRLDQHSSSLLATVRAAAQIQAPEGPA